MKSQTKFNMCSEVLVEISRGEQDWTEVRECLVRAFHHYSLYKYLIPNEQTRPEFLRRYLEAIYDVTIRNGNSILLVGRLSENNTIIGGVMVVPPSKEYGGWECEKADDFYEAYEKYRLRDIDLEAFERMKKYEEWEYENISKHVCSTKVPLWNGIFCAVDPKYSGKGCGSMSYNECLKIIKNIQESNKKKQLQIKHEENLEIKSRKLIKRLTDSENSPMLFMISHSKRAVRFHLKNGFQSVADIPYYDENTSTDQDNSQFNATVLMMDPLNADRIAEFRKKINFPTKRTNNIETGLQMTHISVTAESHLIHNSSITSIINMYGRLKITRNRG
ncbi:uncharacterized protein LOC144420759 [Styela clava]